MSRETEKIFREFNDFIKNKELNEKELEQAFSDFIDIKNNMPDKEYEDAWDYLDMAYQADREEDALKYAKKALKIDKNCLDAEVMIANLTNDDPEKLKIKYESLIKKAEKHLKKQDIYNEENKGAFWGIVETRSYMRLRAFYLRLIISMGKFKKAINECEDLLSLSENDNLGVRYKLISLYALYEDETNALKLYKKYKEDNIRMLLPLVAMYYKRDNYKKAEGYLKRLNKANSQLLEFFYNIDNYDEMTIQKIEDAGMYAYGSEEEIIITISENSYLYDSTMTFHIWIVEKLIEINE